MTKQQLKEIVARIEDGEILDIYIYSKGGGKLTVLITKQVGNKEVTEREEFPHDIFAEPVDIGKTFGWGGSGSGGGAGGAIHETPKTVDSVVGVGDKKNDTDTEGEGN